MKSLNKFRLSISDPSKLSTFRSHIGLKDLETPPYNSGNNDSLSEQHLCPKLLNGEMIIAEAQNVLLYTPVSDQKTGQSGVLFVTNFKLSFVTSENSEKEEINCQKNNFLTNNEVCLSNVDTLYQVGGERKRKLLPGNNISDRVKGLYVVCKNMKSLSFSFKFSPMGHGKTLTNALLHHAFPRRHQLLFAYDYREPYIPYIKAVFSYRDITHWHRELDRTNYNSGSEKKLWRISSVNNDFQISSSLPRWIVVSSTVLDWQLVNAAFHFNCGRLPIWCWSSSTSGAALVRMADLITTITDRVQENIMLETVRKAHPKKSQPIIFDLTKDLPSPKELDVSYNKLRDLCTPDSLRQFWVQDKDFLSLIESSKWLTSISQCLTKSLDAAKKLEKEITVALQERDGRDMCSLISSLVQIYLDPYYRTLTGFQCLIQKEWIVMGHAFSTRLGHVYNPESQQAPLLLLFLDCVWQLLQQFPSHFEFTETFLTTLWDCAHISIFDTFLFDCDRDRILAAGEPNNPLTLRSLWDWGELLSDKDISLFHNPLYNKSYTSSLTPHVRVSISNIHIWSQCYFRFLPQLEIVGGGTPQIDFICRTTLNQTVEPLENSAHEKVGSFYPFTQWRQYVGVPPPAELLMSTMSLNTTGDDTQSILTVTD